MRLGKRIYNSEGLILLGEHVELTQSLLQRLEQYGIHQIYIEDPRTSDIVIRDMLSDETRIRAITEIRDTFRKLSETDIRRKAVGQLQVGKSFRGLMDTIMQELSTHKDAMIMLSAIHATDEYLFHHSLNVCIYSVMLGMADSYTREELMTLGLGSLLHDIGKIHVPLTVLNKTEPLSDEEFSLIQQHTVYGFQYLKDEPNIPLLSAHCALQHHERLDGSGYPRGLKGNDIHELAKVIGIVDSYDAMTTNRVYRRAMLPHQAMERLFGGCGTLYDKEKLELFRDKIAIYPIGITVTLSTGEKGVVVDLNTKVPHRPIVRILEDEAGQQLDGSKEMDLSKVLNVIITDINDVPVG